MNVFSENTILTVNNHHMRNFLIEYITYMHTLFGLGKRYIEQT